MARGALLIPAHCHVGGIMKNVLNHTLRHHRFFEELTRIPHGSFHEAAYSGYLAAFAQSHGFPYFQDAPGNVIIYKPASPGYEDRPSLAVQAHMDMVWAKEEGCPHNFETDPLDLYIEEGYLRARGTTLGADDGTGVAYILAVLDDPQASHPPLEAIFTVQEEVGLHGALALREEGDVRSHRLISLDCGGGDSIYISSLGGLQQKLVKKLRFEGSAEQAYRIELTGLAGEYSSGYLQGRENANQLCARLLCALDEKLDIRLISIAGGALENRIARSCSAVFACGAEQDAVLSAFKGEAAAITREIGPIEAGFQARMIPCPGGRKLSKNSSREVLSLLSLLPCGLLKRSARFPQIMSLCANWSTVRTEGSTLIFTHELRASSDAQLEALERQITLLANTFSFATLSRSSFPAWEYREDSRLCAALQQVFHQETGRELGLIPVQGGLECGVFASLHEDMDIIAMGPVGLDVHTPNERLDLSSFDGLFPIFQKLLASL